MWEKFTLNKLPSSHIQEVSNRHTGREVNPTPHHVHTSTDASKEGLSSNTKDSHFYARSLQKAQLSPDFGKSLLIQRPVGYVRMPSSPVGAQETGCLLGFGLSCVWKKFLA